MSLVFWLATEADTRCDHEDSLNRNVNFSKEYISISNYFLGKQGEVGEWDIFYDKVPCNMSRTPFTRLVSEIF